MNFSEIVRAAKNNEELESLISAATLEIKERENRKRNMYLQAICDALQNAYDAGYKIVISDEDAEWHYVPTADTVELR